ncbi:hypothetical protein CC78DRAFT_489158 [Lojkania enalia]|uniref:G-patch domain-containing protein n=1 Tax=Lojkania enalia TaxID=147567 RepID=A0A9P4KIA2_9PLEO|nr:hypothetical protein CC78DRAFT_489158 [Didymosphaeria enalia]
MDVNAYLKSQGWRGAGHSLDHHGRGIKKPLLITHKRDQLGLGSKKAAYKTDDQWWMRAFDESLKSIGTGQESALSQVRKQGINRGGLYGFFVQGEGLAGTIDKEDSSTTESSMNSSIETTGETTLATSISSSDHPPPTPASSTPRKRKQAPDTSDPTSQKQKKSRRYKEKTQADTAQPPESQLRASLHAESRAALARELYGERAKVKGRSFEEYVLRRAEKYEEKRKRRRERVEPQGLKRGTEKAEKVWGSVEESNVRDRSRERKDSHRERKRAIAKTKAKAVAVTA